MAYEAQVAAADELLSMTDAEWDDLANAMTVLLVDAGDAPRSRAQRRLSAMATQISRAGVTSAAQRKKEADAITGQSKPSTKKGSRKDDAAPAESE